MKTLKKLLNVKLSYLITLALFICSVVPFTYLLIKEMNSYKDSKTDSIQMKYEVTEPVDGPIITVDDNSKNDSIIFVNPYIEIKTN